VGDNGNSNTHILIIRQSGGPSLAARGRLFAASKKAAGHTFWMRDPKRYQE
jgi:hypothetical protein